MNPTNSTVYIPRRTKIAKAETIQSNRVTKFTEGSSAPTCINSLSETTSNQLCSEFSDLGFNLDNLELTPEQKQQIQNFLIQNRDIFAKDLSELGHTNLHYHTIYTGDAKPISAAPYRQSPQMRRELDKQLDEMQRYNIIEESTSPWHSPVVLVKKRNGSIRVCVDFRALNRITEPMSAVIPTMTDIFDTLADSKAEIFSSLDLTSGFCRSLLDPATKHKSAFITHKGSKNPADCLSRQKHLEINNSASYDSSELADHLGSIDIPKEYTEVTFIYKGENEDAVISSLQTVTINDIQLTNLAEEQETCKDFTDIIKYKQLGRVPQNPELARAVVAESFNFELEDGILKHFYSKRCKKVPKDERLVKQIAVPRNLRDSILKAYHDCILGGGHQGFERTYAAIRNKYFWIVRTISAKLFKEEEIQQVLSSVRVPNTARQVLIDHKEHFKQALLQQDIQYTMEKRLGKENQRDCNFQIASDGKIHEIRYNKDGTKEYLSGYRNPVIAPEWDTFDSLSNASINNFINVLETQYKIEIKMLTLLMTLENLCYLIHRQTQIGIEISLGDQDAYIHQIPNATPKPTFSKVEGPMNTFTSFIVME
ncbi:unnamed protein product [Mytilus coruscus]|uniref:Integrase zinc-binding domain-containing protein n=1 Tax=Mytilus coruscus TaxID=42192 RepID=A0A6J8C4B9_MYTCO|nr:unnamed protein product [Mytilus coruscus]